MVNYLILRLLSSGLSFTSETDASVQAVKLTAPAALTCAGVRAVTGQPGVCETRATAEFYACHTRGECATDGEHKRWVRLLGTLGSAKTFVYANNDGTATVYTLDASGTGIVTSIVET